MSTRFFWYRLCCMALVCVCFMFVGCESGQRRVDSTRQLLTVDFESENALVYNFICERETLVDLDPSGKHTKGKKSSQPQKNIEKLELQISYSPTEVDLYGYSTITARCEQAKVTRTSSRVASASGKKDAAEYLQGKTFTLKITPTGEIVDHSSLLAVIKELGVEAFAKTKSGTRIKDPDMIMDIAATQWTMWDAVAAIEKPLKGVKAGQKWQSKLVAPMSFVMRSDRDVEYRLAGFEETQESRCAIIESTYSLAEKPMKGLPMPYTGSFQMRGMLGFLRNYKIISIEGTGRQVFDVEKGIIKSDRQSYTTKVSAAIFGLGSGSVEPNIIVNQTITTELVE
ncbi:MAG: hypothetical protein K8R02_00505 [Anaerohalosphaeraceae bacterium]|nr:hypothetical protein [Anaerohalosphaeraceae bacterium]